MKGHILYVEDDESVRKAIEKALRLAGYEVLACASTDDAATALQAFKFDAAVSDWNLGRGGNGGQVYALVKSMQPDLATRFLFLSGEQPDITDHVPWLEKPAMSRDILHAVAQLTHTRRRRQTSVGGLPS